MKHTVTEHKLASGAQGLIVNVPGTEVANILVRFNSGYQFADQRRYEVPHVMEHMLANVTQKYPASNQFSIEAQKNGAYVNAYTGPSFNGYVYECAAFELDRILDLLEEQLVRPLFTPEALAGELGNVREELTRNTTQHGSVCSIRLGEAAFPGRVMDFEKRLTQLGDITADHLQAHYNRTHTAANARFFVAGSFADGGRAIVERLERLFAQLPTGERLERNADIGLNVGRPIVIPRDIKQLYYCFDMYLGELTEDERRAKSLLRLVLLGGKASRVYGAARRHGWAYHVSGGGHAEKGNSSFGFSGYVTPTNAIDLFTLMADELRHVAAGRVTETELTAAKNLGIGSTTRSHQTAADILDWYVGPYDNEDKIIDFAGEMDRLRAIPARAVAAVAQKILDGRRSGLSLVGDVDDTTGHAYAEIFARLYT